MKIAVFGLGYVGFTGMCCLASEGHEVIGIDVSEKKVRPINTGSSLVVDTDLYESLQAGFQSGVAKALGKLIAISVILTWLSYVSMRPVVSTGLTTCSTSASINQLFLSLQ